jgi:N-acetylglucosamine-6-sulfatase
MTRRARRPLAAALAAASVLAIVGSAAPRVAGRPAMPPNVILVITDDQTVSSLVGEPVAMPWLAAQLSTPGSGWWTFTDAVVTTPACCPSRATILTGRDAWATGVVDNTTGERLDDTDTLATRLHDAGYRTGLVGKYLNGYPWGRPPFVPPGWDRWLAKTNIAEATTYYDYALVDQTRWRRVGSAPGDHVVDLLSREAQAFVRSAPLDRPFFLVFSPPAPHRPAVPAPRDVGLLQQAPPPGSPLTRPDAPSWLRDLPPVDPEAMARERLEERASLRSVDRALAAIDTTLAWRGDLDRTAIVVVSDNGYQFGERGWVGKQVPWESSIRVPLAIRLPGSAGGELGVTVTNADLAPTVLSLVGLPVSDAATGLDLVPVLRGRSAGDLRDRTVRLGWAGSAEVPPWVAVRRDGVILIRWADGTEELYDVAADPDELRNLADVPAWAARRADLEAGLPPSLARVGDAG